METHKKEEKMHLTTEEVVVKNEKGFLQKIKFFIVKKVFKISDDELVHIAYDNNENVDFIKNTLELFADKYEKINKKLKPEDDFKSRLMYLALKNNGEDFEQFCLRYDLKPKMLQKCILYKSLVNSNNKLFDSVASKSSYVNKIKSSIMKQTNLEEIRKNNLEKKLQDLEEEEKFYKKNNPESVEKVNEEEFIPDYFYNNTSLTCSNFDFKKVIEKKSQEHKDNQETPGFSSFKKHFLESK